MTSSRWCLIGGMIMLGFCATPVVHGSKILLSPYSDATCNSHLRNYQKIGLILADAGHEVHLIFPSNICSHMRQVDTAGRLVHLDHVVSEEAIHFARDKYFETFQTSLYEKVTKTKQSVILNFESMLQQPGLMDRLAKEEYDFGILDPIIFPNLFLMEYLDIPIIWFDSGSGCLGHPTLDIHSTSAVSYHPRLTPFTDRMNFLQRMYNFLDIGARRLIITYVIEAGTIQMAARHGYTKEKTHLSPRPETAVLFLNNLPDLEYPRPFLPNVVMVGGLFMEPSQPLPSDMEAFMQGADHGVVVVSFGTYIYSLPLDIVNRLARVFAQLQQRVIWKYTGQELEGLGSNTLLYSWLPQNDLLGHPKTSLFVTHCGMNGIQEAAYHGVPVVAMPLMFDQFHNANLMTSRSGAGKQLDIFASTEADLREAINDVINNDTYRLNSKLLARRFVDQPVPPRDLFLHWVDRVSKDGYLEHLQPRAAWELTWFQYYLLDVIGFLLFVGVAVALLTFCVITSIIKRCFTKLGRFDTEKKLN